MDVTTPAPSLTSLGNRDGGRRGCRSAGGYTVNQSAWSVSAACEARDQPYRQKNGFPVGFIALSHSTHKHRSACRDVLDQRRWGNIVEPIGRHQRLAHTKNAVPFGDVVQLTKVSTSFVQEKEKTP